MEEAGDAKHASESIYRKLLPRNVKIMFSDLTQSHLPADTSRSPDRTAYPSRTPCCLGRRTHRTSCQTFSTDPVKKQYFVRSSPLSCSGLVFIQTFAQSSASWMFTHSHLHWLPINLCRLLQSEAVFLHWHLHFVCSFTVTTMSPSAWSLCPPVNLVFLTVTGLSTSSDGEHVVPVWAQQPPHCWIFMHDGK